MKLVIVKVDVKMRKCRRSSQKPNNYELIR